MRDLEFNIEISVRRRKLVTIDGFRMGRNRLTVLLGESGIGKSLVARALYGLLDPDEYSVRINGRAYREYCADPGLREMQKEGFFVFQEPSSHLHPLLTVREQLQEGDFTRGPEPAAGLRQLWQGEALHDLDGLLEIYPKPYRPSGGEKQRILLAMALNKLDMLQALDAGGRRALYIFDEPTGSLDNEYRNLFLDLLLKRYRRTPVTVLFITHDYSLIRQITTAHRDLEGQVDYRELATAGDRLVLREFQAASFSSWLGALERLRPDRPVRSGSEPLLTAEGRLKVFGRTLEVTADSRGEKPAPLTIFPRRLTYLKAPSGTGKTTVAKAIMGLLPAEKLHVTVAGIEINEHTRHRVWSKRIWGKAMTMVFQHADEALNMHSTVQQTLRKLPSRNGRNEETTRVFLNELYDPDGVPSLLGKKIWMLSGGQKQKLNLLRGFLLDTDVLILDEPLNGLDFESCTKVIDMTRRKLAEGKGILVISHSEEIFDALCSEGDRRYLHVRTG